MAGLLSPVPALPVGATIAAELHRWATEPFDLASNNCGLSVISYVSRMTGRPIPAWLGAFGRLGAARLMRSDAQFEAVAARALAEMGCPETECPEQGDVALVHLAGSGLLTASICAGSLWAARGDRAAVLGPGTVRKAWRVECHKP